MKFDSSGRLNHTGSFNLKDEEKTKHIEREKLIDKGKRNTRCRSRDDTDIEVSKGFNITTTNKFNKMDEKRQNR